MLLESMMVRGVEEGMMMDDDDDMSEDVKVLVLENSVYE